MATIVRRGKCWQLNWSDERGQHRISLGPISRQDAEIKRREKDLERLTGRRYAVHSVAVEDFAAQYLDWYAQQYPSTYPRTASIFRLSLLPHFGTIAMDQLCQQDFTAWITRRRASIPRPAPATVTKEARALAAMMRRAVEWGALDRNPLQAVRPPPERQSRSPMYYTREQLVALYEASGDYATTWRLLANTGLRRNEALYLRMTDVGPDALRVESREESPTKTRKFRQVPLNDSARAAVASLTRERAEYLLPRIDQRSLSRAFLRCARRAGLPGNLHVLRHTFVSHLVMAGVDLATVQRLAGHASITTTMRYAHLSPQHQQAGVARIAL